MMVAENRLILISFTVLLSCAAVHGDGSGGGIRLWRNGSPLDNINSGRVQVRAMNSTRGSSWGNICSDNFIANSADVVCHQLGYTGANSFSDSSRDNYGTDNSPTVLTNVRCSDPYFLVIFQCNLISSSECPSSQDVSVECYSTRIWDNPYNGQVRLTGGDAVNNGLVEIYCNGQWGTVCDDSFGSNEATSLCRQLGYSSALTYNHLSIQGATSQPIWLNRVYCRRLNFCITRCSTCPMAEVTSCRHDQDVTVSCYHQSGLPSSKTTTMCSIAPPTINPDIIVIASLMTLVPIGVIISIVVPIAVVCCVVKCGNSNRTRNTRTRRSVPRSDNTTSSSRSLPLQPVSQEHHQAPPSSQAPPTSAVTYTEPIDPTITEAPPPAYGQHAIFATYTGPSGEDKSKQLPPYPNPPPQAFTPSAPPPPDPSPYPPANAPPPG